MLDIGWSELLVIAIVAIVVVGPKDLPKLMRSVGHYAGKLRRAAADFQRQFEDAMRESELEEMRKSLERARADMTSVDEPVMLPKPAGAPAEDASVKPKPQRRPRVKPKNAGARGVKKSAERAP
ncbi:MAG TPA: Sec-independent protein translocase protein TatB [Xanthobacteraceae bacterium]|nr:Sec-independent protein translocase protein TatB [Xanthobacteraceae bacterium]